MNKTFRQKKPFEKKASLGMRQKESYKELINITYKLQSSQFLM